MFAIIQGFPTTGKTSILYQLRVLAPWCRTAEADELRMFFDVEAFTPAAEQRHPVVARMFDNAVGPLIRDAAVAMDVSILFTSRFSSRAPYDMDDWQLAHVYRRPDPTDVRNRMLRRAGRAPAQSEVDRWQNDLNRYFDGVAEYNAMLLDQNQPMIGMTTLAQHYYIDESVHLRLAAGRTWTEDTVLDRDTFDAVTFGAPSPANRAYITRQEGYRPWASATTGPSEPFGKDWIPIREATRAWRLRYQGAVDEEMATYQRRDGSPRE